MTTEHEPHEPRPARQLDEALGEVTLFGEQWTLRVKAALVDEPYRRSLRSEIVPVTAERGTRTVVHAQPYVLVPHITLDVAPASQPTGDQLGEVTDSRWEGMRPEYVGQAQAWYYDADRLLVIWEALLEDRYQTGEAPEDANLRALWLGFEAFLLRQFPDAEQLVTSPDDPLYEPADYQRFLRDLGYQSVSSHAFGNRRP